MVSLKTVIDQSMTVFEKCHWPVNDNLKGVEICGGLHLYRTSLTGQWQFSKSVIDQSMTFWKVSTSVGGCTFTKRHWPVNDSFQKVSLTGQWHFERCQDLWGGAPLENVIDRSMTVFEKCHWPVNDNFPQHPEEWCTFTKSHWPVNDSFQKVLLTSQW